MSAKYELQDILRIRDRRKDAAETALLKAKQALREAEQFLKEQQDKEADFIQKKPKFIQRIYELALEKIQFRRNYMDIIAFKLGKLDEHQMKLAVEVEKAHNKCNEAHEKVRECVQALTQARKEVDKIEEHKKIWKEDMRLLDEFTQDKELEDFKTKEHHG